MFWSVFVRLPEFEDTLLVSQAEQMQQSRCFRESNEPKKLGCISCHDPHSVPAPEQKVAFYRTRCLTCHGDQSCKLEPATRKAKVQDDSCIVCHMPKLDTADITHTAITDHRIARMPRPPALSHQQRRLQQGEVPLIHFHAGQVSSNDPELARDLGLALVELTRERSAVSKQLAETAMPYLDSAIRRGPKDIPAWEARAQAQAIQGQSREALASCEQVLTLAPSREMTLIEAARCAERLDDRPAAIVYWERTRTVAPWVSSPRFEIARLRSLSGQWEQAAGESRELLRVNPAHINARLLLVGYYLQAGDKTRAQSEFDAVLALHPSDPQAIRRWYAEKAK
jgi:predicted CXXCH cytochrome family protein